VTPRRRGRTRARALGPRPPGRFRPHGAIAAVHAEAPTFKETDWAQIVSLYDLLLVSWPSPVVALNRAVAVGLADGPAAGLEALGPLAEEPRLACYRTWQQRVPIFSDDSPDAEARLFYDEALMLTENGAEREFLAGDCASSTAEPLPSASPLGAQHRSWTVTCSRRGPSLGAPATRRRRRPTPRRKVCSNLGSAGKCPGHKGRRRPVARSEKS